MNDKRKPLGRGLASLIPAARSAATPAAASAPAVATVKGEVIQEIPVDHIEPNPYQTRLRVDEAALQELAASIKASGVLQPIVVRFIAEGKPYQLIAGQRRWLASKAAGRATVPGVVRHVSPEQAMEMTIIENLQREDLGPVEQARAFERLSREFNLTQEQMAQKTGKDRSSISNYLRLLKLPEPVLNSLEAGELTMGHAKALMMLESPEAMVKAGLRIVGTAMSVRQAEQFVHSVLHPVPRPPKPERQVDPNVKEAERELQRRLGCKIQINDRKGKGSITIEYANLEDFDRVLEALTK